MYKQPKNWQVVSLDKLVNYILDYRGKTPKKSKTGIPTLSAKSVKNNYIDYSEVYYISSEEYSNFMRKGLPNVGDVLLTVEAPLGLSTLLDRDDVGLGQRIVTINGKNNVLENRYLKFYLQSPYGQHELQSRATGTTVTGISQKNLRKINIILPSYEEQEMIANLLSSFDDKIENNNAIIVNLEEQAQTIFKSWFVDFEPFQDGEFVESELGLIPKDFSVVKLKEISTRRNGYSYKSKELNELSDTNMITLKNFNRNGGTNFNATKPIDETERMKDFHYLNSGDILIACTDLTQNAEVLGRTISYLKNEEFDREVYSMDLVKIEPDRIEDKMYIYYYLSSFVFKSFAEGVATGTTVLHFPKKSIDEFKMIYPSSELINKFSNLIKPILLKQNNLTLENKKLEEIRDTLLPKLMSGEIRVEEAVEVE